MADKTENIKTRLSFDGEAQYKAACKEINSTLKVLSSEMKLITAEYKNNSGSIEALRAKQEVLRKTYDEQAKKVKETEDALRKCREATGENSEESKRLETQLNYQRSALANTSNALQENAREQEAVVQATSAGAQAQERYRQACQGIDGNLAILSAKLQEVDAKYKNNASSAEAVAERQRILRDTYDEQKKKLEETEKAYESIKEEYGENSQEARQLEEQLYKERAALYEVENQIAETEQSHNRFGDALGKVVRSIGAVAAAVAVTLAAAVAATASCVNDCIDVFAGFDDSMKTVAATMGMTSEEIASGSEEYKMLEDAAKEAGASTKFSASESAEALNYLALAGYDAEKAVETLPKVLNLAAAGGMELAETSDLVTDSMAALGLKTSELDNYIDEMAKTSQKSNTSVKQLGEATLVVAGTASTVGMSLETMNAELGVLANNGIKGSEGGTHLRNVLLSLSAPTDTAAKALNQLGVETVDSQGNIRDLNDILIDLNASMDGMSDSEKTNMISTIFNKTDIAAVNALLKGTESGIDDMQSAIDGAGISWDKYKDKAWMANGGAAGMFEEAIWNLKEMGVAAEEVQEYLQSEYELDAEDALKVIEATQSEFDKLKGQISDCEGAAADMAETMESGLAGSERSFNSAMEGMQIEVGAVFAGMKQNVIGSATDVIRNFTSLLKAAGGDFGKIGGAIGTTVGDILNTVGEYIPQFADVATNIVVALVDSITGNLPQIMGIAGGVMDALVDGLMRVLPMLVSGAAEIITSLASGIGQALPNLIPVLVESVIFIVEKLIENIPLIISAGLQLITGLVQGIVNAIPVLIEALPEIITAIINGLIEGLPLIIASAGDIMIAIIDGLINAIPVLIEAMPQIIAAIVVGLIEGIPQILMATGELVISIITKLGELPDMITEAIQDGINRIAMWGSDMQAKGNEVITKFVNDMINIAKTLPQKMWNAIVTCISKIAEWGTKMREKAKEAIANVCTTIVNGFADLPAKMVEIGSNIVQGIWNGISSGWGWLKDQVSNLARSLLDAAKGALGIASPSKKFRDEVGVFMAQGIGVGFSEEMEKVNKTIESSIPQEFDIGAKVNLHNSSSIDDDYADGGQKLQNGDLSAGVVVNQYIYANETSYAGQQKAAAKNFRLIARTV